MTGATMEERVGVLEANQADTRKDIHEIQRDVRALRDQLAGRPTWAVCTIITLLTGAVTALTALLASAY